MRRRLRELWQHLTSEHTTPTAMGKAVAVGLFIGCLPLYGLHLPLCIGAAWLLKLNKMTVYAAASISIPIIAPLLVAAGIGIGQFLRFGEVHIPDLSAAETFIGGVSLFTGEFPSLFASAMLGDAVLGLALGGIGGPLTWWLARRRLARRQGP